MNSFDFFSVGAFCLIVGIPLFLLIVCFVKKGIVLTDYQGIQKYENDWVYIYNGVWDKNARGMVKKDTEKWFVKKGRIVTEFNGLQTIKEGNIYYF